MFSCRGIQLAVEWFLEKGHKDITVFVPAWRKEQSRPDALITGSEAVSKAVALFKLFFDVGNITLWCDHSKKGGLVPFPSFYILRKFHNITCITIKIHLKKAFGCFRWRYHEQHYNILETFFQIKKYYASWKKRRSWFSLHLGEFKAGEWCAMMIAS